MPLPNIDLDLIRGENSRRTSKSLTFTVMYPCWKWLTDPSYRFLFASYALSLAERDSVKCRRLISSPLYQKCFGSIFQITADVDTKRHFENDKTGYRQSISVGSATKGLKGNFICCDDPHDASQADSEIKKEETIAWFQDSFFDRLCNFSTDSRCVIGQRIAKNDLSNFILENYKQDWVHLNIPYEYAPNTFVSPIGWKDPRSLKEFIKTFWHIVEPSQPFVDGWHIDAFCDHLTAIDQIKNLLVNVPPSTEEGQPLNPERFPDSAIRQLKRKSKTFSCQWNQNPIDSENALFKAEDFRYYTKSETAYHLGERRIAKADCWRLMAVDLAISLDKRADYSVIMVADVARTGEIILVHTTRERIGGTRIVPTLQAMSEAYRPAYVLIEDVAFQRMVLDQARQQGLAVRGIRPDGDKESRTLPLQVRFEAGQVWFPQGKPWLPILETELIEFPNSRHDDTVDTLAYIAYEAGRRNRARPEAKEEAAAETPEVRMARGLFAGLR